ncbi:Acyl-CoA N-acyltransferase [Penicillium italicum]|uniref:Acyl-CoA N-acyltransferase n=1 Tax=Penicillium italicum TaxID=40296 RepID=A0A0A2KPT5_PENIT|nr:Acyl-CoA N-acyltransferase [Penicillium italicum]
MKIHIVPAQFPDDAVSILSLFSGYAASLGIDLTFQSFQEELDSLPGKYSPSQGGSLLIARVGTGVREHDTNELVDSISSPQFPSVLGCVALRRNSEGWCEMKRLYVLKEARGEGLGEKLVEAILAQARYLGYRGMRLDTLPEMTAARLLYRKHGIMEIEPYYETPIQRTIFMGCEFI